MVSILIVGLAAGVATALLFAAATAGSMTAVLLFYIAPLPILIASLGWSHVAGLLAAASATLAMPAFSGVFLVAVAVIAFGAWWLGYLTLLARPASGEAEGEFEWYPIGRLVLWAAGIGTLVVAAVVPTLGTDQQSLQAALRTTYERILNDQAMVDFLVLVVPPAAAVFSTVVYLFNLWLAARIVKMSGRLKRPWPDLSALTLPRATLTFLLLSIAASFLPDLMGILGAAWAASLIMILGILGLAVLHFATRGMNSRPLVLAGVYATVLMLGWPLLLISLAGLSEMLFGLRLRIARRRHSPRART
jgi:hypothetical protein